MTTPWHIHKLASDLTLRCMQVYISYGQKTSGQLLLSYGFMPETGANPHDACLLEVTLAEDDPGREAKLACLRQYGAEATREFPLRLDALPQGLLLFAAFAQAQPRDAGETMSLGRQLFEKVPLLCEPWSEAVKLSLFPRRPRQRACSCSFVPISC
jgi:hypothetical protein